MTATDLQTASTPLPQPELLNADFVTALLVVGGDLHPDDGRAADQVAELVSLGVRHVVDTRIEWSDEALVRRLAPSLTYHHLGIDDAGQRVPGHWFEDGVARAQVGLRAGERVFVHCHAGINRSTSLIFAILLAEGWDVVDALTLIRRRRQIAVMAYVDDALRWWHERTGASTERRADDRTAVALWRLLHPLDLARVVRRHHVAHEAAWSEITTSRYLAR